MVSMVTSKNNRSQTTTLKNYDSLSKDLPTNWRQVQFLNSVPSLSVQDQEMKEAVWHSATGRTGKGTG